jgi:xylose isomerase
LSQVAEVALELQKGTSIRPLWVTAQLFKHPRYMHGAATSERRRPFLHTLRPPAVGMRSGLNIVYARFRPSVRGTAY